MAIAPCEFELASGTYNVHAELAGYIPVERSVAYDAQTGLDLSISMEPVSTPPVAQPAAASSSSLMAIVAVAALGGLLLLTSGNSRK